MSDGAGDSGRETTANGQLGGGRRDAEQRAAHTARLARQKARDACSASEADSAPYRALNKAAAEVPQRSLALIVRSHDPGPIRTKAFNDLLKESGLKVVGNLPCCTEFKDMMRVRGGSLYRLTTATREDKAALLAAFSTLHAKGFTADWELREWYMQSVLRLRSEMPVQPGDPSLEALQRQVQIHVNGGNRAQPIKVLGLLPTTNVHELLVTLSAPAPAEALADYVKLVPKRASEGVPSVRGRLYLWSVAEPVERLLSLHRGQLDLQAVPAAKPSAPIPPLQRAGALHLGGRSAQRSERAPSPLPAPAISEQPPAPAADADAASSQGKKRKRRRRGRGRGRRQIGAEAQPSDLEPPADLTLASPPPSSPPSTPASPAAEPPAPVQAVGAADKAAGRKDRRKAGNGREQSDKAAEPAGTSEEAEEPLEHRRLAKAKAKQAAPAPAAKPPAAPASRPAPSATPAPAKPPPPDVSSARAAPLAASEPQPLGNRPMQADEPFAPRLLSHKSILDLASRNLQLVGSETVPALVAAIGMACAQAGSVLRVLSQVDIANESDLADHKATDVSHTFWSTLLHLERASGQFSLDMLEEALTAARVDLSDPSSVLEALIGAKGFVLEASDTLTTANVFGIPVVPPSFEACPCGASNDPLLLPSLSLASSDWGCRLQIAGLGECSMITPNSLQEFVDQALLRRGVVPSDDAPAPDCKSCGLPVRSLLGGFAPPLLALDLYTESRKEDRNALRRLLVSAWKGECFRLGEHTYRAASAAFFSKKFGFGAFPCTPKEDAYTYAFTSSRLVRVKKRPRAMPQVVFCVRDDASEPLANPLLSAAFNAHQRMHGLDEVELPDVDEVAPLVDAARPGSASSASARGDAPSGADEQSEAARATTQPTSRRARVLVPDSQPPGKRRAAAPGASNHIMAAFLARLRAHSAAKPAPAPAPRTASQEGGEVAAGGAGAP
jgi:hypothetical protein